MTKITAVINVRNEAEKIKTCLSSLKWVSEIVVVDMESTDDSAQIARQYGAKVFPYKYLPCVEQSRNFSLSKVKSGWILILDPDEEIPDSLSAKLIRLAENPGEYTYFRLPRKNIVFGKWLRHSRWWPDYNIRFFKKDAVRWLPKIHSVPVVRGEGIDLEAKEAYAIIHHHYQSVGEYLERLNRYTAVQAEEMAEGGYQFSWPDLLKKPLGEFLSRYFAGEGYKDGLHGLSLALLQSFSEFIKYLKVWEKQGFSQKDIPLSELSGLIGTAEKEMNYWQTTAFLEKTVNPFKKIYLRFRRKFYR